MAKITAPVPSLKAGSLKTTSFTATWTLDPLATKGYKLAVTIGSAGASVTGSPFTIAAGTSEQAVTGLTAGTAYGIQLLSFAAAAADNSDPSAEVMISTKAAAVPPSKLATPVITNDTAKLSQTKLTVTWPLDPGATKYQIKVNAGTYADATSPHEFTGLTADTDQIVKLKAIGNGTSFTDSDEGTKTIKTKATLVPPVTALSWKTPASATKSLEVGTPFVFETPVAENGTAPIVITHAPASVDTTKVTTAPIDVTYTATDSATPAVVITSKTAVTSNS